MADMSGSRHHHFPVISDGWHTGSRLSSPKAAEAQPPWRAKMRADPPASESSPMATLPPEIFKAYDIRGIVGRTLTPAIVRAVGQALGSLARERGRDTFAIGRDGRLSGPELLSALSDGIRSAGVNVIDVGMVATPMTYFATYHLNTGCSVMVTGSHNPPDYNGLKMVVAGDTLSGDDIQGLRARIES